MNVRKSIRSIILILALFMGAANGAWALEDTDIVFDPVSPSDGGTVELKSIVGQTVTITVKPNQSKYCTVKRENIVVQKLQNLDQAQARRRTPDIANYLEVTGAAESESPADYTFEVPTGYVGALVTVTFTTMPLNAYTYNIIDTQGNIAIKCTVNQPKELSLSSYEDIPEAIRSPYLEGEDVTFYSFTGAYSADNLTNANKINATPVTSNVNIYVKYTTTQLSGKPLNLDGATPYKIQVNGQYIYDNKHGLRPTVSDGDNNNDYLWKVTGSDPYRLQIQNLKSIDDYLVWSISPSASLTLDDSPSNFIILGGSAAAPEGFDDQVELMAATGADIGTNPYYNVGRATSYVELLSSDTYPHGNDAIQVRLKAVQRTITFHIIDLSGHIVVEQSGNFNAVDVPEQWKSPLVQTYHYWTYDNFRVHNGVYTLRLNETEISNNILEAPSDIYVTYEPSDTYDLDGSENRATDGKKYLLKFAGGTSFQQENGKDGFEATAAPGIYPYINGEGGLFVFGDAKLEATRKDVASTRTRWAWYLEGGDPYRLRISSLQTRTDGNPDEMLPRYSYLRTYMPKKGYDKVVTGVISNNSLVYDASDDAHALRHQPTDYMILNGTNGHFRLVTSDVVDDYDDATVDVRHTVTSFENYWKTNPTAAQVIHDYYENDGDDQTSFAVGNTPTEEQITAALTTGEGAIGWHSYNVWAYGSTWESSKKTFPESFQYDSHWFQTIGVGTETETPGVYNGDFDLEEYDLDGALILLDQHGWEVMRKPITNLPTKKEAYAQELRKFDSPMVKKYHFWINFQKEDGYHKYKPKRSVPASSSKDAQDKGTGTSLADYPEVLSTGTLADIYVTYEVMSTYRDGYKPQATEGPKVSKYLIRQGTSYAKTTDGSTIVGETSVDLTDPTSIDDELLWYVKPNINIDTEMGYQYIATNDKTAEQIQAEMESAYYSNPDPIVHDTTNGQNGFDPYNLQIESVAHSDKLFTINNVTGYGLDNNPTSSMRGGMISTYDGEMTVTLQSYTPPYPDLTTNYYDTQKLHVTNSTFMAVSDDNGNIRLMPRFDHHHVVTEFTILDDQQDAEPYGDESGTQTTLFVLPSTSSSTPGEVITVTSSDEITDMNGNYQFDEENGFDITKVIGTKDKPFKGTIDGKLITIDGVNRPLVAYADGATIKNVILKTVSINAGNADGNAGAICCQATGSTRIYNCGILPTTTKRDKDGNITGFTGSHVRGKKNVGSIVGLLDGTSRVINCFSYANVSGSDNTANIIAAGIVGNNAVLTTMSNLKTMVMNCMFYGNITDATTMKPVYGGQIISNAGTSGVNNYNYYRDGDDVTFDDNYSEFSDYYCSLPADEEYLTRFEYYRSILNSNKKLCTWWINGTSGTAPTDADVKSVGIAKWVLDPEIAPYPILKKWGKYPSVINQDPEYVWNPITQQKVSRTKAAPYQGKQLKTISVTVKAGSKHAGSVETPVTLPSVIVMDMDTLNHDYGYAKIQLPYYNELFGDPSVQIDPNASAADKATQWNNRYGGNYKDYVVTGWKITNVMGGTPGSFKGYEVKDADVPDATKSVSAGAVTPDVISATAWEDGFNFADRNCTNKDLYSKSGRVFAQGGYYYVPEGVTAITIEAYWGKAVYLHNKDHSLDRVNVASGGQGDGADFGTSFSPAGTLPTKFQNIDVQTTLQQAISALTLVGTDYTVYDQAIVLVGNVQVKNRSDAVGDNDTSKRRPFTIMSIDEDMDNEPDYCLEFQFRNGTDRPGIHPIRFDFLPVPELGLAIRTNTFGYTIGIFIPQGHFEITETAFMHTTQFEYDGEVNRVESPIILNGGHFEQIVVRYGPKNKVSYFLLGGHFRMKRFTPGYHVNNNNNISGGNVRHCAVNAIGGDYPEFYLSGIYRPDWTVNADNPHCYINGGRFGIVAGAGYEQVNGDVTFKIDHSIIREFYGGGINGAKPVTGEIDVTINNSLVNKYCGGPKVGKMTEVSSGVLKTVTTNATGTTFGVFYGGGNGGTSYYRQSKYDNTGSFPAASSSWTGFTAFNPLNQINEASAAYKNTTNENWGYHAEYEFEVFNSSNGLKSGEDVLRCYYLWAQFGTTTTGNVASTLTDCTITGDFFGGGNLANVTGDVTSILKGNTHVYGSVFGGGYSASIPSFPVHDKGTVSIPTHDAAGNIDEQGSLDYYQDGGKDRLYTWCYKNTTTNKVFPEGVEIPDGYSAGTKQKSVFRYPDTDDGKWYVLTTESLENLGAVNGNATITLDEDCVVDGSVYGGGDASAVKKKEGVADSGNTIVNLQGNAHIYGNVFGGGNKGLVNGSATVNIRPETPQTQNGGQNGEQGNGQGN